MRVILLFSDVVIGLTAPLFTIVGRKSGRDLVLLIAVYFYCESTQRNSRLTRRRRSHNPRNLSSLVGVLIQIALLDMVFSLDSVITAVGMVILSGL